MTFFHSCVAIPTYELTNGSMQIGLPALGEFAPTETGTTAAISGTKAETEESTTGICRMTKKMTIMNCHIMRSRAK